MSLTHAFASTLQSWLELDEEDPVVDAWDRRAPLDLNAVDAALFADYPCADAPPMAHLFMQRTGDEPAAEFVWRRHEDEDWDECPVVDLPEDGSPQCVAPSVVDYIDALLYTGGLMGGGSSEDLRAAREQATDMGLALADELLQQLDRALPDPEILGERWEELQDELTDDWTDALEEAE